MLNRATHPSPPPLPTQRTFPSTPRSVEWTRLTFAAVGGLIAAAALFVVVVSSTRPKPVPIARSVDRHSHPQLEQMQRPTTAQAATPADDSPTLQNGEGIEEKELASRLLNPSLDAAQQAVGESKPLESASKTEEKSRNGEVSTTAAELATEAPAPSDSSPVAAATDKSSTIVSKALAVIESSAATITGAATELLPASKKDTAAEEAPEVDVADAGISKTDLPDADRPPRTEELLKAYLRENVPSVSLDAIGDPTERVKRSLFEAASLRAESRVGKSSLDLVLLQKVVSAREDLDGLPFQWGGACQLGEDETAKLADISGQLQRVSIPPNPAQSDEERAKRLEKSRSFVFAKLEANPQWRDPAAVSGLEQMLQVQQPAIRARMVDQFAAIEGAEAARAVARRALFDFSPKVRTAAISALRTRNTPDIRAILVKGLQYPWDAVSWNAAEALVELADADLVPQLRAMLDGPSPNDPFQDENGQWRVRELVAVQHLRNCMLCHAASNRDDDQVRGVVPVSGQPLPPRYYASKRPNTPFCRADIVYLKQDFSAIQPVKHPDAWPAEQRFDYLVRSRLLSPSEIWRHKRVLKSGRPSAYPQRRAIALLLERLKARASDAETRTAGLKTAKAAKAAKAG